MIASHTSHFTIQRDIHRSLHAFAPAWEKYSQFIIVTHPRLKKTFLPLLLPSLEKLGRPILEIIIPSGERSKCIAQAKRCWEKMAAHEVDRQAAVLALGGGVICDLAGFVASCYMRGIDTLLFPTTLLAMVDAAIGGKTAINLPNAKNCIGSFHMPKQIIVDPSFLDTLPTREFRSGFAEIIKYGMISSPPLIDLLNHEMDALIDRRHPNSIEQIIETCISIKQNIVAEDEKDLQGLRAALNYGHTFAHAIEAVSGYRRIAHGEAVSIGMSCAINLSAQIGLCDPKLIALQDALCRRAQLPVTLPFLSPDELLKRMRSDKKTVSGKINLILLEKIGKVVKLCDVDPNLIKEVIISKMCKESI